MVLLLPSTLHDGDALSAASNLAENAQDQLAYRGCSWQQAAPAAELAATVSSNQVCTSMASQFQKMEERQTVSTESTLQVLQRECAVIDASPASPAALGSDAATTCHIVAFRDPATCKTALTHLDNAATVADAVSTLLTLLAEHSQCLDCYIVGGYEDPTAAADGTCFTEAVLAALHAVQGTAFRLLLACCGIANTQCIKQKISGRLRRSRTIAGPVKRSLAVCAATGEAWPIYFTAESRGPAYLVRSCRTMGCSDTSLLCIYNCSTAPGLVTVPVFQCESDPRSASYLLSLPDDEFLQYTSTSPLLEGMCVYTYANCSHMHSA
jgi:Protein N-terminal asparagine amidohydrolase